MFLFYLTFGLLSLLIGSGILIWLIYNLFVVRMPEFQWSPYQGLGLAPAAICVGIYWLRKAFKR